MTNKKQLDDQQEETLYGYSTMIDHDNRGYKTDTVVKQAYTPR